MIYIVSPYTANSAATRRKRLNASVEYAASAMREGVVAFSPLAHGHMIAEYWRKQGTPVGTDYSAWRQHCEAMIDLCSSVHVLKVPGWKKSKGVAAEIEYAQSIGKEIVYIDPTPQV